MSRSALLRLEAVVTAALPVLEARLQRPLRYRPPSPPVSEREAEGFFRSVDAGFFDLEDDGLCIPRTMRPSTGFSYPLLSLLRMTSSTIVIWREWLTHATLPALLHFDLGYPRHDIALDVDAFDALAFSRQNRPLLAVEAKKTTRELEKTVSEISEIVQEPFRLRRAPRLSNSEQKARSLLALRPRFFLAVAPDTAFAFAVRYPRNPTEATAMLEQVSVRTLRARTRR